MVAGCGVHHQPLQQNDATFESDNAPVGPVIVGNGKMVTEKRHVSGFRKIRANGIADITIHMGESPTIVVTGDANLLPSLVTHSRDGLLTITERGHIRTKAMLRVDVTTPSLEHVTLEGADSVHLNGVKLKRLGIDLNGTGDADGSGTADALSLDISGAGNANLTGLRSQQVDVSISGTGNASVTAAQAIAATVSGAGSVVYSGNPPVVTKSVTGTGAITSK
jgi:hypothetical protein